MTLGARCDEILQLIDEVLAGSDLVGLDPEVSARPVVAPRGDGDVAAA
jgi:hypothetical protein